MINPEDPDWERTASGRSFSYKYGYGVLDAFAYVTAAQNWQLVKPQAWIMTNTTQLGSGKMAKKHEYEGGVPIGTEGVNNSIQITTEMMLVNNLEALEHIDVRVWIDHPRRGNVMVELVSPNGIKSVLAETRDDDDAKTGFPGWRFMTIKHWYVLCDLVVSTSKLDSGEKIQSATGPLKSPSWMTQILVYSWDGTWFSGDLPLMLPKRRCTGNQ